MKNKYPVILRGKIKKEKLGLDRKKKV